MLPKDKDALIDKLSVIMYPIDGDTSKELVSTSPAEALLNPTVPVIKMSDFANPLESSCAFTLVIANAANAANSNTFFIILKFG